MLQNHMQYLLVFLFAALAGSVYGQKQAMYPVSDIPEALLKKSNAVIREDITEFSIINPGLAKSYAKMAVTILNKKAESYAEVQVGYDKLSKIKSISARSYDKNGKLIKVLKNKDFKDYSSFDGFSIYSDNRIKYFDLRYVEFPYTIVYEVEMEEDGLFVIPGWVPYSSFNVSSEKSSLEISSPLDYEIRYQELNMESSAKESQADGRKVVRWDFGNYESMRRETRMPFLGEIMPRVLVAPSKFEMEGYEGDMSSWASFGAWERELNSGRDDLPPEFAEKVRSMVKDIPSRTDKIKKVYEYLQQNTRYVSIQLGIGGWQSFPASDVVNNGYGDCKALSNFTKAMLKAVDIDSYYTLVKAGRGVSNINTSFPSNQFNHMILCVPNYQDTIWLECTSQDNPFGYLGSFTGDRNVLVINDDGGAIARTKSYEREDNKQVQSTHVKLNADGSALVTFSSNCSGRQYENYSRLLDIGESDQKKWIYRNLDIPSFELASFEFTQEKKIIPVVSAEINLTMTRFASQSGKRLFFQPNVFNKIGTVSIPQKERQYDFVLRYPYEDTDSVVLDIPEGYHMEFIPEKTLIESKYGHYESEIIIEEARIIYKRTNVKEKGTFPAEEYEEYVKYMNKIAEADKLKLVLVKST